MANLLFIIILAIVGGIPAVAMVVEKNKRINDRNMIEQISFYFLFFHFETRVSVAKTSH